MLSPAALLLAALPQTVGVDAPPTLEYYLGDRSHDPNFPTPASVLGWEVGEWHARHDQVVEWFEEATVASPRVSLTTYGRTHEARELLLAAVTSPGNQARLEELRAAHVAAVKSGDVAHDGPTVVWMGYGVHGNEPSATQAALVLLYHLAASNDPAVEAFLEDTIVLIDPCLNPDGHARFAQWANMHKGRNLVADSAHREHREVWPGGRTNHYWFDLNRDWLLLTHPESRGRITQFQRWMPSVVTDYHEMGTSSSYFFQPGIPTRRNPITPQRNVELTSAIADYHAAALDRLGSLYFTEERFDDFYYGKGSTYPDVHGAIGILFEQASARGHLQENDYGPVSFPFTIRNQVATSLSTLEAVAALRADLDRYQREFYRDALAEAAADSRRGWVFGDSKDSARTQRMVRVLLGHGIQVHRLTREVTLEDGTLLPPGHPGAFAVPTDQPQYRLVRALFETRTSWSDNTFYDVSSWTLPLSFGLSYGPVESTAAFGEAVAEADLVEPTRRVAPTEGAPVAWLSEWHDADAPRLLAYLLRHDVQVRVSTERFTAFVADDAGERSRNFDRGTLVVPVALQDQSPEQLEALLAAAPGTHELYAATSGRTPVGSDLGSGSMPRIAEPKIALIVANRTSSYEAGEVWHHLDVRVGLPVALVEASSARSIDLDDYTHLVVVNGAASGWGDDDVERVREWVSDGGVLIATKSSALWAARALLQAGEGGRDGGEGAVEDPEAAPPVYGEYSKRRARSRVAGTIFEARLDRSHPLTFGYTRDRLPVFRNFTSTLPEPEDPFSVPVRYTDEPLLSGYASEENVARIAGSPAVRAERIGSGTVVCMVDNPLFRGVWDGTSRLFDNALFFAKAIERTGPLDEE